MQRKRLGTVVAVAAAVGLLVSACGSKPATSNSTQSQATNGSPASSSGSAVSAASGSGKAIKACMLLDNGGVNDESFNQFSYAGMLEAHKSHPNIAVSYLPSSSSNDYAPNESAAISEGCDPIIVVGSLQTDAMKAAAAAHPSIHFAIVDSASTGANVYGLQFNTAQGAFLAGLVAAGVSKTGKVATFGGADIPPVTNYMNGYWEGVQYYNKINHKSVQVLGWNENNQKGGTFVPGNNPFDDPNGGQAIAQSLIQQGADVIFPLSAGSDSGAEAAVAAKGGSVSLIHGDVDGCLSTPKYCKYTVTSALKGLQVSVSDYLDKVATGTYPTGNYIGTLANGGTGIAPFHDFDSKIPSSLKSQVAAAKAGIESGSITITSPDQPKA